MYNTFTMYGTNDNDCLGALNAKNEGCFVENNYDLVYDTVYDMVCNTVFDTVFDIAYDTRISTNNTSLPCTINDSAKQNEVINDNNIEYNPSYNNGGGLIKYDCIDAHGIDYIPETNVDKRIEANSHN